MEYIKIPYGGQLVLKFFNPLFNDISSYSLPMSFNGKLDYIQRAFGYPNKPQAEIKPYLPGRIKTQFLDIIGSWGIDEASNDNISAFFKPGSGDFYSQIQNVLLSDLDYGGIRWAFYEGAVWDNMRMHLNSKMDVSYPDSEYCAYMAYMPNAVNINIADDAKLINEVIRNEEGVPEFVNGHNTAAYLFVGTILDYLFNGHGYKIEENIFRKDPDLKRLTVFNTFNLRPPGQSEFHEQARIDYKCLVPHISCSDFLKAIRDRFNIGFFINEQKKSVRIKSFDYIISDGVKFSVCSTRPKLPTLINNRLTGITFPLNEPDSWSKHNYKSVDELYDPIIVNKYRDILPLTRAVGTLLFVQSESAYYRITLNNDTPPVNEAQHICTDLFPFSAGDGSTEITQSSGIPAMYTHAINEEFTFLYMGSTYTTNTDVDFLIPRCDLVGNGYEQQFTEFPLMFLFARGIQNCSAVSPTYNPNDNIQEYANLAAFPGTGSAGIRYLAMDSGYFYRWIGGVYTHIIMPEPAEPPAFTYPLGTSDVYDANGLKITSANRALKWDGEYGLIKWLWANRINWELNIKKLIRTELLSEDISKLIDMDEWKRMADNNYLVNSFEIAIDGKNVKLQNVELLRL
jgi:hypothetical protein